MNGPPPIEHPRFNGVPILLGDEITFSDGRPERDTTGVVCEIRRVNGGSAKGQVWIFVLDPPTPADSSLDVDYRHSDWHERNEIVKLPGTSDSGRVVVAHKPRTEVN